MLPLLFIISVIGWLLTGARWLDLTDWENNEFVYSL